MLDAEPAHEAHQTADRDVALTLLDHREEGGRDARRLGDVGEREAPPPPELAEPRAEGALAEGFRAVAVRRCCRRPARHAARRSGGAPLDPLAQQEHLCVMRRDEAVPAVVVHRAGPPGDEDHETSIRVDAELLSRDDAGRDAAHELRGVASDLEVDGPSPPRRGASVRTSRPRRRGTSRARRRRRPHVRPSSRGPTRRLAVRRRGRRRRPLRARRRARRHSGRGCDRVIDAAPSGAVGHPTGMVADATSGSSACGRRPACRPCTSRRCRARP